MSTEPTAPIKPHRHLQQTFDIGQIMLFLTNTKASEDTIDKIEKTFKGDRPIDLWSATILGQYFGKGKQYFLDLQRNYEEELKEWDAKGSKAHAQRPPKVTAEAGPTKI